MAKTPSLKASSQFVSMTYPVRIVLKVVEHFEQLWIGHPKRRLMIRKKFLVVLLCGYSLLPKANTVVDRSCSILA